MPKPFLMFHVELALDSRPAILFHVEHSFGLTFRSRGVRIGCPRSPMNDEQSGKGPPAEEFWVESSRS